MPDNGKTTLIEPDLAKRGCFMAQKGVFWPLFGPSFFENGLCMDPFDSAPSPIDREKNQKSFGENRVPLRRINDP